MAELTHFDAQGNAHMVDVGGKAVTERIARAAGQVIMAPETLALIQSGGLAKGDVLGVARLAGIMAAKRTAELIPLCHPLQLSSVSLELSANSTVLVFDRSAHALGNAPQLVQIGPENLHGDRRSSA